MTSNDLVDRAKDWRIKAERLAADRDQGRHTTQATLEHIAHDNEDFLQAYRAALRAAEQVVMSRQERGEHDTIPLSQVFVHGLSDITFLLFVKARRLIALEKGQGALKIDELREEGLDMVNYSAMLVALLDRM